VGVGVGVAVGVEVGVGAGTGVSIGKRVLLEPNPCRETKSTKPKTSTAIDWATRREVTLDHICFTPPETSKDPVFLPSIWIPSSGRN
jgi:hypothetical protein